MAPSSARIPTSAAGLSSEWKVQVAPGPPAPRRRSTMSQRRRSGDTSGLLVVKYGFHAYGLDARTGALAWSHRSATPILAIFASSRLEHVLVQSEVETFAIEADGTVAWRIAHSDVVTRRGAHRRASRPDQLLRPRQHARSGHRPRRELRDHRSNTAPMWTRGGQPEPASRISWTGGIDPRHARPVALISARRGRAALTAAIASTPTPRVGSFGSFAARQHGPLAFD